MNAKRQQLCILMVLVLSILLGAGCGDQAGAQEEIKRPTLVPASALTPAPTPADAREVAILTLAVSSNDDGQVEGVQLEKARILNSFAPNVFGRRGPWTIELVGEQTIRYGILDPRQQRVYADEIEEPHTTDLLLQMTWEPVVPLFDGSKDLGVKMINIYDHEDRLIFSTEVDREAWREQ